MMKRIFLSAISLLIAVEAMAEDAKVESAGDYQLQVAALKRSPRPVIFNNDGCDAYYFPADKPFSLAAFLARRTSPLANSDVTTISYCTISSGFGRFTHPTKYGELLTNPVYKSYRPVRNAIPDFISMGTDPLKVVTNYASEHGMEVFWSNRINDCHDYAHRADKPFATWSKFKEAHPEYLFGAIGEDMPYGRWSAVDFSYPEIRRLETEFVMEVAENYKVSGIELDFMRHCHLFRQVAQGATATAEQCDLITSMMREIRSGIGRIGERKRQPMLLSVRIPDSTGYCRAVGIDIERWLEEGLVDIIIGGDYFQLNDWSKLVELGHRYGVKAYAGLSEPRVTSEHPALKRLSELAYRARAAAAWNAGVDGLYIFNEYCEVRNRLGYLKEIGGQDKLARLNKLYFINYCDGPPNRYLKDGKRYQSLSILTPAHPLRLPQSAKNTTKIFLGREDDPAAAILYSQLKGCDESRMTPELNGTPLQFRARAGDLVAWTLPANSWRPGENNLTFKLSGGDQGSDPAVIDTAILFLYDPAEPKVSALLKAASATGQ